MVEPEQENNMSEMFQFLHLALHFQRALLHSLSCMGGSTGELNEELVTQEKRKEGWGMNCDVGETTEGLENEL